MLSTTEPEVPVKAMPPANGSFMPTAIGREVAIFDASLVPAEFTDFTRNWYDVLFVNPVTVAVRVVDTPSLNVDQVVPSVLYSTT